MTKAPWILILLLAPAMTLLSAPVFSASASTSALHYTCYTIDPNTKGWYLNTGPYNVEDSTPECGANSPYWVSTPNSSGWHKEPTSSTFAYVAFLPEKADKPSNFTCGLIPQVSQDYGWYDARFYSKSKDVQAQCGSESSYWQVSKQSPGWAELSAISSAKYSQVDFSS